MKILTIKNSKADAAGKIGQYIRINKGVGVKVVGFKGCQSVKSLLKSKNWKKAEDEAKFLKIVGDAGLSPLSYGVHPVKFKGRYFAGIFMDHIDSDSLNNITPSGVFTNGTKVYVDKNGYLTDKDNGLPIMKYLKTNLSKIGIYHSDIHGENVLIDQNNRVWLIDFSADYIRKKRK